MDAGSGADPENELGGGQFRGSEGRKSPSGVQGRNPGRESGGRSPPEADDFSRLKGYLDVNSGILGGMAALPPPLKSASDVQRRNATIRGPRHFLRSGPLPLI